jgi:hypothetical protein
MIPSKVHTVYTIHHTDIRLELVQNPIGVSRNTNVRVAPEQAPGLPYQSRHEAVWFETPSSVLLNLPFFDSRFPGFLKSRPYPAIVSIASTFEPWVQPMDRHFPPGCLSHFTCGGSIAPKSRLIRVPNLSQYQSRTGRTACRSQSPLEIYCSVVHGSYGTPTTLSYSIPVFFYPLYFPHLISFPVCAGITLDSNGTFAPC